MWGIIPAAGIGSRIQPLAFSKELLPVGSQFSGGKERPRAVSEYLIERMIRGGVTKLCFIISPEKTDILQYYGAQFLGVDIAYVVQSSPAGLCDALFRSLTLIHPDEEVVIGLPDTIWYPLDAITRMPSGDLSLLLFPTDRPEQFDAVLADELGRVSEVRVKQPGVTSKWIWGAIKSSGRTLRDLHEIWCRPERGDEYLGTLINTWIGEGGEAFGVRAGTRYVDVGTLDGYRQVIKLLAEEEQITLESQSPLEEVSIRDERIDTAA